MDISTLGSCIAIVMICYIVGMGCKASKRISDEWIPVIMAVIGGILGVVGMGIIPDFPATDYITAVAVGMFNSIISITLLHTILVFHHPSLLPSEVVKLS
jgi:multisubunit Na+/H+ antiporter MnhB subunit